MAPQNSLSTAQSEIRAKITKSAIIWGVIIGLLALGIVYWILSSQSPSMRLSGAIGAGALVGFGVFTKSKNSGATGAKCANCNAAFSVSKTDSQKIMVNSEAKETREDQGDGSTKVTNWVKETYDVTDTYTCAKCADITTKEYQTHSKKDEVETIEHPKTEAGTTKGKGAKKQSKPAAAKNKSKDK